MDGHQPAMEASSSSSTASHSAAAPAAADPGQPRPQRPRDPQRLLILVGLVGSGKSTFTLSLCSSHPSYARSNQDVLGNRKAVIRHVRETISRGKHAVVDRTNVDAEQRRHWIALAGEMQREYGTEMRVHAVVFDTPFAVCEARLKVRTDHETLSPDRALEVLRRFSSTFVPPTLDEGFDGIITLGPADIDRGSGGGPSEEQIEAFLRRLDEAERAADANGRAKRNREVRIRIADAEASQVASARGRGRGGFQPQQRRDQARGGYGGGQGYYGQPPPGPPYGYAPHPPYQQQQPYAAPQNGGWQGYGGGHHMSYAGGYRGEAPGRYRGQRGGGYRGRGQPRPAWHQLQGDGRGAEHRAPQP